MQNPFQPAMREKLKLRICFYGLSGSGKTLGALRVAYGLCRDWSKIALIDADNRSSLGYANDPVAGVGQFLFAPLDAPFTAQRYLDMIKLAVATGAEVVIIDTMSQEWAGEGGVIEQHDKMGGNSYTNWGKVNPPHNELINYITHKAPCHVIINFRAKMKHAQVESEVGGYKKTVVEKLDDGPVMRPGTEYEFHLTLQALRGTYRAEVVTKRGSMLPDMQPVELSVELGERLAAWAESGESMETEEQGKKRLVVELAGKLKPAEIGPKLKELGLLYTLKKHDEIRAALENSGNGNSQPVAA